MLQLKINSIELLQTGGRAITFWKTSVQQRASQTTGRKTILERLLIVGFASAEVVNRGEPPTRFSTRCKLVIIVIGNARLRRALVDLTKSYNSRSNSNHGDNGFSHSVAPFLPAAWQGPVEREYPDYQLIQVAGC